MAAEARGMKLEWPDYEVTPTCPCPFNELCRTEYQIGMNRMLVQDRGKLENCNHYAALARQYRARTDEEPPLTAQAMWERYDERRGLSEEEAA